jgi:hypothetical protein
MKCKIKDFEPFEGSDFGNESQEALKKLESRNLSCGHNTTSDFSYTKAINMEEGFEHEKVIHKYCNTCGMHLFRDKEYTKKEWDALIESCDFKD